MARNINPAPGSPRPMQRGSFMIPPGSGTSVDVTVNPMDPLKAQLAVNGWYAQGVESSTATNDNHAMWEIVNATTIRFSRAAGGGGSPGVLGKWELKSWN